MISVFLINKTSTWEEKGINYYHNFTNSASISATRYILVQHWFSLVQGFWFAFQILLDHVSHLATGGPCLSVSMNEMKFDCGVAWPNSTLLIWKFLTFMLLRLYLRKTIDSMGWPLVLPSLFRCWVYLSRWCLLEYLSVIFRQSIWFKYLKANWQTT